MQIPRMRTAAGVVATLRAEDPETAVSVHMVRQLILSGAVPYVESGTRKLVNVDTVCEYLMSGRTITAPPAHRPERTIHDG